MSFLLELHNLPFSVAAVLLGVLLCLEIAGMAVTGFGLVSSFDNAMSSSDSLDGGILTFLHFGKVPLLALLAIFLSAFATAGYLLQTVVGPLSLWVVIPASLGAALLLVRLVGSRLAAYIQTGGSAPSLSDLRGLEAVIQTGSARSGHPAQAKVIHPSGGAHYVMVEPEDTETSFEEGEVIILASNEGVYFRGRRQGLRIG